MTRRRHHVQLSAILDIPASDLVTVLWSELIQEQELSWIIYSHISYSTNLIPSSKVSKEVEKSNNAREKLQDLN